LADRFWCWYNGKYIAEGGAMTLVIELPPELERRLEEEAARCGQDMGAFARAVLEERLAAVATGKPMWRQLVEIGDRLPDEEKARLPADASENLDHYLYGVPRKQS
jgi:predicted DNA-binding protein